METKLQEIPLPDAPAPPAAPWMPVAESLRAFMKSYPAAGFGEVIMYGMQLLQSSSFPQELKSQLLAKALSSLAKTDFPDFRPYMEGLAEMLPVLWKTLKRAATSRITPSMVRARGNGRGPQALRASPHLATSAARFAGLAGNLDAAAAMLLEEGGDAASLDSILPVIFREAAGPVAAFGNATTAEQDAAALMNMVNSIPRLQTLASDAKDRLVRIVQHYAPIAFDVLKGNIGGEIVQFLEQGEELLVTGLQDLSSHLQNSIAAVQAMGEKAVKKYCGCLKSGTKKYVQEVAPPVHM